MKRVLLLLLPLLLVLGIMVVGCNDEESVPYFTRITVTPACGVVPLQIEGLAIVTGGNESGGPTGGNNNLEITWNFGDGATSNTSLAYHRFTTADTFAVVVTAKDPDGQIAVDTTFVRVFPDTLLVEGFTNLPDSTVGFMVPVQFDVNVSSCTIDPDNDDDYRNLTYKWETKSPGNHIFYGRSPRFAYGRVGIYRPVVTVTMPGLAATRTDTLWLEVVPNN